jgi:glucose-6-phosphate dehydrogenase assembly protein OpcA
VNAPTLRARVVHRHGEEALAWLLVGWLSSQLGRPSERELASTLSAQPGGEEALSVSIGIGEASAEITATMSDHQVAVTLASGAPPFFVAVPRESDADSVAAELQTFGRGIGLIESVRAANVRLASGANGFRH